MITLSMWIQKDLSSGNATDEIVAMGREKALRLRDDQYNTDPLKDSTNAPEWVREWRGPFYVEVEEQVRSFFGMEGEG